MSRLCPGSLCPEEDRKSSSLSTQLTSTGSSLTVPFVGHLKTSSFAHWVEPASHGPAGPPPSTPALQTSAGLPRHLRRVGAPRASVCLQGWLLTFPGRCSPPRWASTPTESEGHPLPCAGSGPQSLQHGGRPINTGLAKDAGALSGTVTMNDRHLGQSRRRSLL